MEEDRAHTPRWWERVKEELFFGKEDRGLPSLNRGWRTPDPSPSRRGRSPLRKVCEEEFEDSNDASTTADEMAEELPREARLRTPSPEPAYTYCVPCDDFGGVAARVQRPPASPTLAPWPAAWPTQGSVGHPHTCAVACKYFAKGRGCKDDVACDHCHLCEWKRSTARDKAISELLYRGERVNWPSQGSAGHPHQCATACKYMRKKHGCRDGADCQRCHVCWHRRAGKGCARANAEHQARA